MDPLESGGKPVLIQYVADISFVSRNPEETVFVLSELDQDPRLISAVRPVYPKTLLERGVEGWVRVLIVVDKKGNVKKARGQQFAHPDFVQPAIDAVLKWKFEPGYKDGRPVKVRWIQPIAFKLL